MPVERFVPEVHLATRLEEPAPVRFEPPTQVPLTEKQPVAMVMPFAKVEEAVVPLTSIVPAKAAPPVVVVETPTPKPFETKRAEVEALVVTAK